MAFTPLTLPKSTTLFHVMPSGNRLELTLEAGTVVRHEKVETPSESVLTLQYTHDGFRWERVQRKPKDKVVVNDSGPVNMTPAKAPVQQTTIVKDTVSDTARQIHNGLDALSARQVHSEDKREEHVRRLDKVVKMLTGKIYRVNYYIPTKMTKQAPSPCPIFHRHCVYHDDGSNWLFHGDGLNHPDVQEVFKVWRSLKPIVEPSKLSGFSKRTGVRFSITELTPEQFEIEKEGAKEQLAQALIEMHETLIERIDKAAVTLQKAQQELAEKGIPTQRDMAKLDNANHGALRQIVESAVVTFERCLRGAELFDDTGSLDAIITASQQALAVTAMGINLLLEAKRVKGVEIPSSVTKPYNASIGAGPEPR